MRIAIVPARGGSKRIPRKNVRSFHGKPILAWSIEAAIKSGCFERVIVSTDDPEISAIACENGAEAPFVRPADLSGDHVPTVPVVAHAIRWEIEHGREPDYVCCLYPASPFIEASDIVRGFDLLISSGSDYAFPVTTFESPIQRALRVELDNRVSMMVPENLATRTQDLEQAFHDAAQFYWGRTDAWLRETPIFSAASALVLPRCRVVDIDTEEDWARAEIMFSALDRVQSIVES